MKKIFFCKGIIYSARVQGVCSYVRRYVPVHLVLAVPQLKGVLVVSKWMFLAYIAMYVKWHRYRKLQTTTIFLIKG